MLLENLFMPYVLAKQHPVMHLSMLTVSLIIFIWFQEEALHFDMKACKPTTNFWVGTPIAAFFWMMFNNVINLLLTAVEYVL